MKLPNPAVISPPTLEYTLLPDETTPCINGTYNGVPVKSVWAVVEPPMLQLSYCGDNDEGFFVYNSFYGVGTATFELEFQLQDNSIVNTGIFLTINRVE